MAKIFKTKGKWKSIVCGILVIAALIASCSVLTAFVKKETKTIGSGAFERGALDENGVYVESDRSIYTKEAFGCTGLRVEPDFEFGGTYDIYFYGYDDNFFLAKTGLTGIYDEDVPLVKTARIVIHPEIPEDVKEKDFKIKFFEIVKYASELTIKVDKKQENLYEDGYNLYDSSLAQEGKSLYNHIEKTSSTVNLGENQYAKSSNLIKVVGREGNVLYDYIDVYIKPTASVDAGIHATFGSEDGTIIEPTHVIYPEDLDIGVWTKIVFEVPNDADLHNFRVSMPINAECYIFGYND